MTKRNRSTFERRMQLLAGAGWIGFAGLAAAAAALIVVSLMLFSAPALRWISSAAIVAAFALFWLHLRGKQEIAGFSAYHTPVMECILKADVFPIAVLDRKGVILEANEALASLLGYSRHELLGASLEPIAEAGSRTALRDGLARSLSGTVEQRTIQLTQRSGFPLDLQAVCSPMAEGPAVIGTVLFLQDLSDRKRNIERIRYMAYYDDLTGLPNRTHFYMKLADSLERARSEDTMVGLCYLDLDRFKLVNASFGREVGDMLLLQVAERLTRLLGGYDFAARLEGEEFVVAFMGVNSEATLELKARAILKTIGEPFELRGLPVQITASIGMAMSCAAGDDSYSLLKKADVALVKAKESGSNDCLLYREDWSDASLARLTLQHEMYRAIERKEFFLMYQPQYDLMTGTIIGVEALLRWMHPERGLIPPGEFISLAEESGMIVEIGEWVLQEACRQNKEWQDRGLPPMPVSVNLSIRQFLQQDLTERIAAILESTGLEPKYLDLEITESMTMDVAHVARCLAELTKLGVGISIDDFGTGYSSFHYLKSFPIDRLKIDRSFVRDIQQDPSDAEIVAAIIAMAHNLNIQVIAEGVETEEQMEFLRKHQCDEMQGYYRSPPVSSQSIEQLLSA
ncbi:putative bifunctional diguanylate cyclase/phosphodiesterase [Paenibacillus thailandensis]|uniref:Bifunctional diguanylate cyclase/phosphodiesterase n=1 Tax=Paenibacillus thailandensis TaxID=393250 RepID=A0ABW5QS78_9BACL